ncbi:sugar-binding domain-containing protein [Gymnodinialimonas sp. 2305UL16-5]|uniref:sugar-binding transcriptional regulator n=1 Tax=Gymnodinialimonas mytili TaxID=3126503 RepID=UPI0030B09D9C
MDKSSPPQRLSGDKRAQLSNVALLYYGEGLTQGEIAKRMKVSRATIVNMLRESRDLGIVDIRVDGQHLTGSGLARALREKFGLEDVYVSQADAADASASRDETLGLLARVAATAILDAVEPGDRIGVAWGETIMAVADAMPRNPVANVEVCQLIGSMISDRVPASENCTIQIANKLDAAACFTLHAPGLISSADLARTFLAEPTITAQMQRLKALDMTIFAIGNVAPDTHLGAAGMATPAELDAARDAGSVGVVCCRYLDRDGNEIVLPPHDRLIAATVENLRAARKRLLAVCGVDRGEAALAAIKGGLVTHLCVDHALAQFLLDVEV